MNAETHIMIGKTRPHARTKRTADHYEPSQDPIQKLPFIAMRGENGLPEANFEMGEAPRCFWHVAPTGDYSADCEIGREYARAYLAYTKTQHPHPGHLFAIVCDMARSEPSGIANGFLSTIDAAARAGTPAARS